VFAIVAPDRQVPSPSPQATDSGRHCSPKIRTETSDQMKRVTIETMINTRRLGVGEAMRKRTRAMLILAMSCDIMYNSWAMTKYCYCVDTMSVGMSFDACRDVMHDAMVNRLEAARGKLTFAAKTALYCGSTVVAP
jgi:hypothetical protein